MKKVLSMLVVTAMAISMLTLMSTAADFNTVQDFSQPVVKDDWSVSMSGNASIKIDNGKLSVDKLNFGDFFGLKKDFTDFALQFEVSEYKSGFVGVSIGQTGNGAYNTAGYMLGIFNDGSMLYKPSGDLVNMTASQVSANAWVNRTWTAGNDNLIDGDWIDDPTSTPKTLTYKIVVKDNVLKMYQKNSVDKGQDAKFTQSMAEWPITTPTGEIRFCSGDVTTFKIDNIRISSNPDANLDDIKSAVATELTKTATNAAVSIADADIAKDSVKATWAADTTAGVTSYIARLFKADGTFVKETSGTAKEASFTGLDAATDYKIQVIGTDGTYILSASDIKTFKTAAAPVSEASSAPASEAPSKGTSKTASSTGNTNTGDSSLMILTVVLFALAGSAVVLRKRVTAK